MKKALKFVYELDGKLYINLTNKCCNDCTFCLRNSGDGVKDSTLWLEREPTAEEVIRDIDTVDFDYSEAVFCGYGESTYRTSQMCEIALHLKNKGIATRLNTNGLGNAINNFDIVPKLKRLIDIVSISLNESDAKSYDEICRSVFGIDAFDKMLDFTKKCVDNGIKTVMTVVDVIGNDKIEKCRMIAQSLGAEFRVRKEITNNESYQ